MPTQKRGLIHFLAILHSAVLFPLLAFISFNPLNAELNPICHLMALLGAHHILHISRIRVKVIGTFIYIFSVSRLCLSTTFFHFIMVFIYIWPSEDEYLLWVYNSRTACIQMVYVGTARP